MDDLARTGDLAEIEQILRDLAGMVLDEQFMDAMSDAAEADFVVPLSMAAALLKDGDYSAVELISAACTVRYCGEPHLNEFPDDLAGLLTRLPR